MRLSYIRGTVLLAATLMLLGCGVSQPDLYVGHWRSWTDGGGINKNGPTRFTLQFSDDSLRVTMSLSHPNGQPDSVVMRRVGNDSWAVVESKTKNYDNTLDVTVRNSSDSVTVIFTFGLAWYEYVGKRQ